MTRVLFAWELGGGFGHLVRFGPLARVLSHQGHEVVVVAKDLERAASYFAGTAVRVLATPRPLRKPKPRFPAPASIPQLLWNTGFGNVGGLRAVVVAWRNLYELVRPDLLVFDHSPQALLASRGLSVRRVAIGSGFFCPPADCPMPSLRPWANVNAGELEGVEEETRRLANRVLDTVGGAPLERFASLYADVDDTALTTFRELDHFPHRRNGRYWGAWTGLGRGTPQWPEETGPRVFAYLKKFATLPNLLAAVANVPCRAMVFVERAPAELVARFESPRIRFLTAPVDTAVVARECDAAILNGNHGTTIAMLLAGKPTLQIPTYLEQTLFTRRITQMGAGIGVLADQAPRFETCLRRLLEDESLRQGAERFAHRYRDFDPARQARSLAQHLVSVANASNT